MEKGRALSSVRGLTRYVRVYNSDLAPFEEKGRALNSVRGLTFDPLTSWESFPSEHEGATHRLPPEPEQG